MRKRISVLLVVVFIFLFSFSSFAMTDDYYYNNYVPRIPTPQNEPVHEDKSLDYGWLWLNDNHCVQFKLMKICKLSSIQRKYDAGMYPQWVVFNKNGESSLKTRDTYTGQWSQAEDGTWSFMFDDKTIPVGITKIDGVLYAFNGYGELMDGCEYWNGQKTGPDGVVTCTDPEFETYLKTQYVPDCTSHKAEVKTEGPGH